MLGSCFSQPTPQVDGQKFIMNFVVQLSKGPILKSASPLEKFPIDTLVGAPFKLDANWGHISFATVIDPKIKTKLKTLYEIRTIKISHIMFTKWVPTRLQQLQLLLSMIINFRQCSH